MACEKPSLVAQTVKNPATMQKTWVLSLGTEDLLEKGMATHSSILAWRIPWTYIVHGVAKSRTWLSNFHFQPFLVCCSVTALFHLAWFLQGLAMLERMTRFHSFLRLDKIPLYVYTMFLFTNPLIDIWVVSICCL